MTVNDYLARRDAEWMGQLYSFLGLTVRLHPARSAARSRGASNTRWTSPTERTREFGFDYLRDNGMADHARAAGPARLPLRDRRRSRFHPDRRSAHAAHHQRPGNDFDPSIRSTGNRSSISLSASRTCFATVSPVKRKKHFEQSNEIEEGGRLHVQSEARASRATNSFCG